MHSEETVRGQRGDIGETRIAIVGISTLTPDAVGTEAYWELVRRDSGGIPRTAVWPPNEPEIDVSRFGIPPVQAPSMARLQLLMLEVAERCLTDAGFTTPTADDRTDVVVGTCFGLDRQYANALRVEGSGYAREIERAALAAQSPEAVENADQAAEELRALIQRNLGASPHDRVGEMASTIPARIASAFKLRGRTLAVESADATSFLALSQAVGSLRAGLAERALVVTGQLREGGPLTSLLRTKGFLNHPDLAADPAHASAASELAEGVGALLLKPLADAVHEGDRIYATLAEPRLHHHAKPGEFGYEDSADHHREAVRTAYRSTSAAPVAVQYVERATLATGEPEHAELAALQVLFGPHEPVIGAVRDRIGHTFAHAGLAAVTTAALALHHRTLPAHRGPGGPVAATNWPEPVDCSGDRPPRRAAVIGSSFTGTLCHLLLEEHRPEPTPRTPRTAPASRTRAPAEPIAVVGYGGRFADAEDADAYWRTMVAGQDRLRPLPEDRLDRELHYAPGALSLAHSYTELGGHTPLPQSPPPGTAIEAERYAAMDATQRIALAVADELFARRAPRTRPLTGRGLVALASNLGLTADRQTYVDGAVGELEDLVRDLTALKGLSAAELELLVDTARRARGPRRKPTGATLDGALASGTAALLAGVYGLDAVPVAVEAACASSLAALDTAMTALRNGTADYALAGGVELPCATRDMVLCSALGLLSHSRITPFDAEADGFTPGDGCALFLLKRESDALRDGDEIVALLTGAGASNDAKSLIAPDVVGQERAMRQAFAQVEHSPAEVDYLEAHGTGTKVGDRVEITATGLVYGGSSRDRPLEIGSAKSFVGHTFAAAGGAGLLRTLLALRAATLPPHTNLRTPNPVLDLDAVPATISTRAKPWSTEPGRPRRAAVSSFGTGGINYHLLVEEPAPARPTDIPPGDGTSGTSGHHDPKDGTDSTR